MGGEVIKDADGNELKAKFTLSGENLAGAAVGGVEIEGTTYTYEGNLEITGLKNGTYTLTEDTAPAGYDKVTEFQFKVENGIVSDIITTEFESGKAIIVDSDGNSLTEVSIIQVMDRLEGQCVVEISKYAVAGTKEIPDAVLRITDKDGNEVEYVSEEKIPMMKAGEEYKIGKLF